MTRDQYLFCIDAYQECNVKQILDTVKIKTAYNHIMGLPEDNRLISVTIAKQTIYRWYQTLEKEFIDNLEDFLMDDEIVNEETPVVNLGVDKTETNAPVEDLSTQSHSEDVHYKGIKVDPPMDLSQDISEILGEISELDERRNLEYELSQLEDQEENKKARRILKMRLTKLNKKIDAYLQSEK